MKAKRRRNSGSARAKTPDENGIPPPGAQRSGLLRPGLTVTVFAGTEEKKFSLCLEAVRNGLLDFRRVLLYSTRPPGFVYRELLARRREELRRKFSQLEIADRFCALGKRDLTLGNFSQNVRLHQAFGSPDFFVIDAGVFRCSRPGTVIARLEAEAQRKPGTFWLLLAEDSPAWRRRLELPEREKVSHPAAD